MPPTMPPVEISEPAVKVVPRSPAPPPETLSQDGRQPARRLLPSASPGRSEVPQSRAAVLATSGTATARRPSPQRRGEHRGSVGASRPWEGIARPVVMATHAPT
ncbi:unnamed protein product [Lampetra fluviatilis]